MSDNFAKALSNGFAGVESVAKEKSFAELFESYNDGMNEDVRLGDKIKGEIISVGTDSVFMNTGTKIDGVVERVELLDKNGQLPYQKGDVLELYVVAVHENEIRLSKAISGVGGLNILKEAFENRVPVEGKVKEQCKGGFNVEIIQRRAFCPISQIDLKHVENPEEYVGKDFHFLITEFKENGKNIIASRRELLNQEQQKTRKKFIEENVSVGALLKGKVVNLMPYGAFVELFPGVEGMIHVSEMSWARVEKPEEILKVNDPVTVKVLKIEPDKKSSVKISLSIKDATQDPWDSVGEKFHAGDKVKGKVKQCMNFGVFVELEPGIEGLVHISEMSYKKRILKTEDVVNTGDMIDVMIKEIDHDKKRISLSMKDAEGDPWIDIQEKYKAGQSVEGIVEKKEKFGYFITLEPGVTGLLPKSKISKSANPSSIEKLKEGDKITVAVEEIKIHDRKISLATGDAAEEDDWKKYSKVSKKVSLGSLGEKLQQAMNNKEK